MLPVIRQWAVVVAFVLWPVVAWGQPPTFTPYEVPPPEYIVPSLLGHPRLDQETCVMGFRFFQKVVDNTSPKLANAAKLLAERRRLQFAELADKCGEFRQLLRGEKTSLVDLDIWLNQKELPGWTTLAEFVGLVGGPLLGDGSEETIEISGFIDQSGSVKGALGIPSPLESRSRQPLFLAELERSLVDLNPRLPATTLKISHEFLDYATHTSINLICDFELPQLWEFADGAFIF